MDDQFAHRRQVMGRQGQMAIVAHTTYSDHGDCGRVNNYLCDGHGLPQADRTNRYTARELGECTRYHAQVGSEEHLSGDRRRDV